MSNRLQNDPEARRGSTPGDSVGAYDLVRWKPINADRFVDELAYMYSDAGRKTTPVQTEDLEDGRQRIVYLARVRLRPSGEVRTEPYFMLLVDPDDKRSRPTVFVRTDVDLPDVE